MNQNLPNFFQSFDWSLNNMDTVELEKIPIVNY
jgi:hypothetical protein